MSTSTSSAKPSAGDAQERPTSMKFRYGLTFFRLILSIWYIKLPNATRRTLSAFLWLLSFPWTAYSYVGLLFGTIAWFAPLAIISAAIFPELLDATRPLRRSFECMIISIIPTNRQIQTKGGDILWQIGNYPVYGRDSLDGNYNVQEKVENFIELVVWTTLFGCFAWTVMAVVWLLSEKLGDSRYCAIYRPIPLQWPFASQKSKSAASIEDDASDLGQPNAFLDNEKFVKLLGQADLEVAYWFSRKTEIMTKRQVAYLYSIMLESLNEQCDKAYQILFQDNVEQGMELDEFSMMLDDAAHREAQYQVEIEDISNVNCLLKKAHQAALKKVEELELDNESWSVKCTELSEANAKNLDELNQFKFENAKLQKKIENPDPKDTIPVKKDEAAMKQIKDLKIRCDALAAKCEEVSKDNINKLDELKQLGAEKERLLKTVEKYDQKDDISKDNKAKESIKSLEEQNDVYKKQLSENEKLQAEQQEEILAINSELQKLQIQLESLRGSSDGKDSDKHKALLDKKEEIHKSELRKKESEHQLRTEQRLVEERKEHQIDMDRRIEEQETDHKVELQRLLEEQEARIKSNISRELKQEHERNLAEIKKKMLDDEQRRQDTHVQELEKDHRKRIQQLEDNLRTAYSKMLTTSDLKVSDAAVREIELKAACTEVERLGALIRNDLTDLNEQKGIKESVKDKITSLIEQVKQCEHVATSARNKQSNPRISRTSSLAGSGAELSKRPSAHVVAHESSTEAKCLTATTAEAVPALLSAPQPQSPAQESKTDNSKAQSSTDKRSQQEKTPETVDLSEDFGRLSVSGPTSRGTPAEPQQEKAAVQTSPSQETAQPTEETKAAPASQLHELPPAAAQLKSTAAPWKPTASRAVAPSAATGSLATGGFAGIFAARRAAAAQPLEPSAAGPAQPASTAPSRPAFTPASSEAAAPSSPPQGAGADGAKQAESPPPATAGLAGMFDGRRARDAPVGKKSQLEAGSGAMVVGAPPKPSKVSSETPSPGDSKVHPTTPSGASEPPTSFGGMGASRWATAPSEPDPMAKLHKDRRAPNHPLLDWLFVRHSHLRQILGQPAERLAGGKETWKSLNKQFQDVSNLISTEMREGHGKNPRKTNSKEDIRSVFWILRAQREQVMWEIEHSINTGTPLSRDQQESHNRAFTAGRQALKEFAEVLNEYELSQARVYHDHEDLEYSNLLDPEVRGDVHKLSEPKKMRLRQTRERWTAQIVLQRRLDEIPPPNYKDEHEKACNGALSAFEGYQTAFIAEPWTANTRKEWEPEKHRNWRYVEKYMKEK